MDVTDASLANVLPVDRVLDEPRDFHATRFLHLVTDDNADGDFLGHGFDLLGNTRCFRFQGPHLSHRRIP